jgi:hypothetical protein
MATNKPYGDGHRHGAVKTRSQVYNDKIERFDLTYLLPGFCWNLIVGIIKGNFEVITLPVKSLQTKLKRVPI